MTTGWPAGMLQDDSRELSSWLSARPGARQHARETVQQIKENHMTNNEKIDALQSCLGASRGQCDERGQKHWDWLEEFRLQLAHDPGTRPEPAAQSGVPFTRSAFHENRRSKWVTFNVRAEHADAAEAALNAAPPAAVRDALQHAEKWREFNGERPAPAADAEPVAWMRPDTQEVATDERKRMWLESGGGYASIARHFTEPLYTRPAAPLSEADLAAAEAVAVNSEGVNRALLVSELNKRLTSSQPTDEVTDAVLEAIDLKAAAGLSQFGASGKHAFLRDIRGIIRDARLATPPDNAAGT